MSSSENRVELIKVDETKDGKPIYSKERYNYIYYSETERRFKKEERKFKHIAKNRKDNIKSVRRSINKLTMLIGNNFKGNNNELFITLTYSKANMRDEKRLYKDFKNFFKRLNYKMSSYLGKLDYIYTVEPQDPNGHNSWHIHCLLKSNKKSLVIESKSLEEIWGNGFIKIKRLKQSDNVAGYVASYLANAKLSDLTKLGKDSKKYIKSQRLEYYPIGIKIYRFSRGIKKPLEITDEYKSIKQYYNINRPVFSNMRRLCINNKDYKINTEIYNIGK